MGIRQSRMAVLAAMAIMAATPALAEERILQAADLEVSDEPIPVRRIVVSLQDRKIALIEGDTAIRIWDAAVGASSSPSPAGEFKVAIRLSRPTWYYRGKVVPPGRSNPLGTRWIGLSVKGFGIHGTNAPKSIGKKASHGCIRMHNSDVEELFELVQEGDAVEIYGESNPVTAKIFGDEAPAVLSASLNGF